MSGFPFRVGCIDAGSNAIRLIVGEFGDPLRWETLHYERVAIRLGATVFNNGNLDAHAIDRCVDAFAGFADRTQRLEVHALRAVATSALREAGNDALLRDRIHEQTGIELEVISVAEEARLVHRAVTTKIDLSNNSWILVDVGGGSVEVSLVEDTALTRTDSLPLGSVRLLEVLSRSQPNTVSTQQALADALETLQVPLPAPGAKPPGFIATGGNMDVLAEIMSAPEDSQGVRCLPVEALDAAVVLLASLTATELVTRFGMPKDRADVILPAALVYQRLAQLAEARQVMVPGVGVKEGVVLGLLDRIRSAP